MAYDDGEAVVEIYSPDGKINGRIVWLLVPNDEQGNPYTDTENPKGELRQRPLIGLDILTGLSHD